MTLDQTAKIANVRKSFKKFMVDNLNRIEGFWIMFDKDLSPAKNSQGDPLDKWISVNYLTSDPGNIASQMIRLFCCSRKDAEGVYLDAVRDTLMGYLRSSGGGPGRVDLYNSSMTKIGSMMVYIDSESGEFEAEDGTKFWPINITLKWGSKF